MEYIFVDFEMNNIDRSHPEEIKICRNEIIEIGAVKLDDSYKEISEFKSYVKPVISPIDSRITELTGITDSIVNDAPEFGEAIEKFISWCGDADVVYAWSENDLRQFNREMKLKKFDVAKAAGIVGKWQDFQKEYGKLLGTRRRISLADAVFFLGEDFQGAEHDALWDARNTSEVFILSKDKDRFDSIMAPIMNIYKPKEDMTYSLGDLFEKINLDE